MGKCRSVRAIAGSGAAAQATTNLSAQEMFERLGIRADIAGYKPVAA